MLADEVAQPAAELAVHRLHLYRRRRLPCPDGPHRLVRHNQAVPKTGDVLCNRPHLLIHRRQRLARLALRQRLTHTRKDSQTCVLRVFHLLRHVAVGLVAEGTTLAVA